MTCFSICDAVNVSFHFAEQVSSSLSNSGFRNMKQKQGRRVSCIITESQIYTGTSLEVLQSSFTGELSTILRSVFFLLFNLTPKRKSIFSSDVTSAKAQQKYKQTFVYCEANGPSGPTTCLI